jgi:hypothetical protein
MAEHLGRERARHRHKAACRRRKEGKRLKHEDWNGVFLKKAVQEDGAQERSISHPDDASAETAPPSENENSYEYYGDAELFPGWELVKEH